MISNHTKVIALRMLLFMALPVATMVAIGILMPFSKLWVWASAILIPFDAHTVNHASPAAPAFTVFATAPGMYISNGAFIVLVALFTVILGRRLSFLANLALFFGIALVAAASTHVGLGVLGYPLGRDLP